MLWINARFVTSAEPHHHAYGTRVSSDTRLVGKEGLEVDYRTAAFVPETPKGTAVVRIVLVLVLVLILFICLDAACRDFK